MENSLSPHSSSQQIFCWGRAASGELGLGLAPQEQRKSNVSIPTVLTAFREEVAEISCGKHHVVFLLKNGLVYSCGSNDFSQLGHSKNGNKPGNDDLSLRKNSLKRHCHEILVSSIRSQITSIRKSTFFFTG